MKTVFVEDDCFKKLQEISFKAGVMFPINKLLEEAIEDLVDKYDTLERAGGYSKSVRKRLNFKPRYIKE